MLLRFRFKNYKSFAEDAILDMTATSNKEHIDTIIDSNGEKILPVVGIFGANGSGKSNFFDAFQTMCTEVLNSSQSVTPFAFDTNIKKTSTEFEVSITIEDKKYRYGFSKYRKEIVEEWLFEQEVHSKEKCIFYTEKDTMHFKGCPKSENEELCSAFDTLPKEKLLLTALGEREKSSYSKVYVWFRRTAEYQYHSHLMKDSFALQLLAVLPKVKNDALNLLQEFDSSIVDLEVIEHNNKYQIYFYHLNEKGNKVRIPFKQEAQGFQKILSLAVWIGLSQSTSLVLFVDDLDTNLHPLILRYFINLYTDPNKNKEHSQLIFSSHNLNFSDLRKDEIWFIEKENQKSTMFSLSDFKTENSTEYEKHYLCGRYGAIPFI